MPPRKKSGAKNNAFALLFALLILVAMGECLQMRMIKARIALRSGAPAMLHTFASRPAADASRTLRSLVLGDQCPDGREYIYDSINDKDNDRPEFQGQGVEKLQAEIKGNRGAQQVALHHDVFPETRVGRTMFDTAFSQSDDGVEYRGDLQKHP